MAAKQANIKWILLLGTLALFAGIIYINWDAIKKLIKGDRNDAAGSTDTNGTTTTTSPGNISVNPTTGTTINWAKVLKKGVKGSEVLILQQGLNKYNLIAKKYSPQLVEDGDFGTNTHNALVKCTGLSSITLNQAYAMMKQGFQ